MHFSETRQKNILRYWFSQLNIELPSTKQLQHILQDVLYSKKDTCPKVVWGNHALRRYQDNLYLTNNLDLHNANAVYDWNLTESLHIPHIGTLNAQLVKHAGLRHDVANQGKLTIRFRQFGERCQPMGRPGSHPLKKLLQEWQIPPWQRDRIPLLYCDNQLVAVVGYCVCEPFIAENSWAVQLIET